MAPLLFLSRAASVSGTLRPCKAGPIPIAVLKRAPTARYTLTGEGVIYVYN
jgi:hypothetical protein